MSENSLRFFTITVICGLALVLLVGNSAASPGDVDLSFDPGFVASQPANTQIVLQSDGKVVIGGAFTNINLSPRNRIARLNADGSLDNSFLNGLAGADDDVYCVALQTNGQVLIGGTFTSVNGVSRNRIARLNSNGSLDTSFLNGLSGIDDPVVSLAVQGDGKVLIGGYFSYVNGVRRNLIARLNTDGSLDNSFLNGLAGANNPVFSVVVQPGGKILIGGAFTNINGAARNSIARLNADGSVDNTFLNGLEGADGAINSIALQTDGKVLVGGSFTFINGVSRNRIARLNTDGSLDTSFLNNLGGANSHIYSVNLLTNGQMLVAGDFTVIDRIAKNRFARLNSDGSVDGWFLFRSAGPNDFVQSIAVQNDGKILISGDFSSVNGVSRNQVARLLTTYSPPKIDDPKMVNGQFAFFLLGSPGQTLVVQASPEPSGSTWTSLSTNFLGVTPPTFIDPQSSSLTKRFYRLLKL